METREKNNQRMRRVLFRLLSLCVLVAVLLAFWRYSPLGDWVDPERLGNFLEGLSTNRWAGLLIVSGFLVGSFVVFPVTAMIAATGIALGPINGLIWALIGSLVSATVNYGLARMLPQQTLENWVGPWIRTMGERFERGGIVAVMVARNLPIAPFTLINVVAGGARIPFRDFLIGTILGMGPIIAALTILGDRLRGALEVPTFTNIILLCFAILLWFVLAFSLQSLSNRWISAR